MGTPSRSVVTVFLLADRPELVPAVGEIRWKEWGHPPEPEALSWWVEVTKREAGRQGLPVTFVAVDSHGQAVGAVGLGPFDLEERRDRSPWVLGMIVRADRRGQGIGRLLLDRLEACAAEMGHAQAWVATGGRAIDFYRRCGWEVTESLLRTTGETTVLTKRVRSRRGTSRA
jgi:GNAT superfamily N-acetyltransferase